MTFRFFYLFLALLFTGCTQLPNTERVENYSWAEQQAQLEKLTDWSFSGKLAFITPETRHSVNIHWQQSGENFHIRLSTFLGLSVLDIQKNDDETIIIDADGKRYVSDDTEQLITELSGMAIPITYLQQWIKGNPSQATYQLNEQQQVESLLGGEKHTGIWSINYSDYRPLKHLKLPHKLQLKRANLRLKFAIYKWKLAKLRPSNLED